MKEPCAQIPTVGIEQRLNKELKAHWWAFFFIQIRVVRHIFYLNIVWSHTLDIFNWITPIAVLVSATAAIVTSLYSVHAMKRVNRTKSTYLAMSQKAWDGDYILARSIFVAARDRGHNEILKAVQNSEKDNENQNKMAAGYAVKLIMNDYELMFIAINEGVLDENLIRQLRQADIIKDYHAALSYITWVRSEQQRDTIYSVFEAGVKRWEAEAKST